MNIDFGETVAFGQFEAGVEMIDMAVHAAVGAESHQVQPAAARFQVADERLQDGNFEELALANRLGDPRQALIDDPAGPEIEMADFGIAHLPVRQSDGFAPGIERGMRTGRAQARR